MVTNMHDKCGIGASVLKSRASQTARLQESAKSVYTY